MDGEDIAKSYCRLFGAQLRTAFKGSTRHIWGAEQGGLKPLCGKELQIGLCGADYRKLCSECLRVASEKLGSKGKR